MQLNINEMKKRDKVLFGSKWYEVFLWRENFKDREEPTIVFDNHYLKVAAIVDQIEDFEPYKDKIYYNGAYTDVEAWARDTDTHQLLYLELVGQEYMVKSISSVLMQGRTRQNDHAVDPHGFHFNVAREGNKRNLASLGEGIAHAIIYHSPSTREQGAHILLGRNDQELREAFEIWLRDSQPLPYPVGFEEHIYTKLEERGFLEPLPSSGIKALKVYVSSENDYADLQALILEMCSEHNLIIGDMPELVELPKSPRQDGDLVAKEIAA